MNESMLEHVATALAEIAEDVQGFDVGVDEDENPRIDEVYETPLATITITVTFDK